MRKSLVMLLVLAMWAVLIGGCGSKDRADQISNGQPGSEEQEIAQADPQKDKDGNKDRLSGTGETDPDAAGNGAQDPENGNNADANGNEAADTRNTGNSSTGNTGNSNGSNTSNSNGTGSGSAVVSISGNAGSGSSTGNTGSNAGNAGNNNSGSSSGNSGFNTGNTGSSGTKTCSHNWVEETTTVTHEATGHYETLVVKEAWDEPVYEMREVTRCSTCKEDIGGHAVDHIMNTGHAGYYSQGESVLIDTIHHIAETKEVWVVDKEAWTETVGTGRYKCSICGEIK